MSHLVSPAAPGKKATATDLRWYMSELGDYMDLAASGTLSAAEHGADVILANAVAPYAYDVAEALGIPALGAHLQPTEASAAYPPVVLGTARSLGPVGNKMLGSLITAGKAPYDAPSARLRRTLGLGKKSRAVAERQRRKSNSPVLHGISPAVLPRPTDWRSGLSLTGYWWPDTEPDWQPAAELVEFLADGPPPVFIGFGSSGALDTDFMLETVRRAGMRAVLQGVEEFSAPDAMGIGTVPHRWLFPQMAAVIHHAGAGTTAAGLLAGVPTVSVPTLYGPAVLGRTNRLTRCGPAAGPVQGAHERAVGRSHHASHHDSGVWGKCPPAGGGAGNRRWNRARCGSAAFRRQTNIARCPATAASFGSKGSSTGLDQLEFRGAVLEDMACRSGVRWQGSCPSAGHCRPAQGPDCNLRGLHGNAGQAGSRLIPDAGGQLSRSGVPPRHAMLEAWIWRFHRR